MEHPEDREPDVGIVSGCCASGHFFPSSWRLLSWTRARGWTWGCLGQRRGTEDQGGPLTNFPSTTGEEAAGGDRLIHDRDLAWLQQADVVVAEVTQPSLGVGYELGRAVALHKPVLCLFRPQSGRVLSAMIRGAADGSRFLVWDYEEAEVEALLDRYFETYPPEQVAASPDPTA
ncbi:5-hydroxymethyl-dUMP N-hydrolase-like [Odocoileus virginianus]|uniref:2'-deoxynucleoside 5'-phosphate N-hydrolase 1 n=1 Tax=Odocoileus virginianus TaxID=9874 RepID=A0ABM4HBR5_ODOVR